INGKHVVAIHDLGGDAVGRGPVGDISDGHLLVERGRVRVLIVFAEVHHPQLLHGGENYALVPNAPAGGAVAAVGKHDVGLAAVFHRQRDAAGHGHAGSDAADDGNQVQSEIAHVHVAVAAAGGPGGPAEVLGENAPWLHAAHQEGAHIAVRG